MSNIAIIGANEFQNPLILKAKSLGYTSYVYAWESGDIGEETADYFIPISIVEKEKIWESCKANNVVAAVSIGSDLAIHAVNFIQRKIGNPCNPEITDTVATNKYAMREALLAHGVKCPNFIKVHAVPDCKQLSSMQYPMIVKPTDRSGSRGIFMVPDYKSLCNVVPRSIEQSFEKAAIIEEYIDGDEYSCESISQNGMHHVLSLTKKYTTGPPHFIETGHCVPSDIPGEYQVGIKQEIYKALTALSITNGASHAEFKFSVNEGARIIEIGARMGGDCIGSDLVELSTGNDFVKMLIDVAVGNKLVFAPTVKPQKSLIRFIFSEKDINEMKELERFGKIKIVRTSIKPIENRVVLDSASRFGFYIYYEV